MDEQLYYIVCTKYSAGWNMSFWKPNGAGYTVNLDEAGKYTEEEIGGVGRFNHHCAGNFAVPCEEIDKRAHRGVDRDSHLLNLLNGFAEPKKDGTPYNYEDIRRR